MAMYFYIAMEIRDIQGNILIDTLVTQDAVKVDELMKQHNITLSWIAVNNEQLPLGAYIDYDGVRYSLLEPYSPEQTDEATYNYKPIFHHPVMRWQYLPFFHYTDSNKELDWSLTDNAANFMSAVIKAVNNETGESWSYEVSSALPASASLSFSNTDIFSALNSIAGAFETEWWFDYSAKVVYLSKAYKGSAVTLEVGKNIGVPSKTGGKEGYFTRFYAFGSTRNIEQNYAGSNVNSIVNKRLTLDPQKYPDGYIDIREGLTNSEILVKTLVFDDIYPRSSLTISDVKVRLMWRLDDDNKKVQIGTDAEGNPVYDQYAIWYFKIPGLEFNKDSIISGKPLSVHFNSGSLNGREFELTYHSEEKTVETSDGIDFVVEPGDYEINFIEEGTYIIPSITGLIPVEGDEITLFNIVMPEEYKASAYSELERAVRSEMAKQGSDTNNYSFNSNKVAFYESNPNLSIGRSVVFRNGSQVLNTRVIKLETQLDYPFEQKITVGNEQIKGTTQTLREEVVSANENIDLISAINKSTEAFTQSLQKTQKAVQNSLAKWAEMWNYDKEHDAARTKLNLIVEKAITFGGAKEGEGEEGGGSAGITIFDVYIGDKGPYSLQNGKVNLPAYPVVPNALPNPFKLTINGTPYDGSAPVDIEIKAGVDDAQLADYAKKGWVEENFTPVDAHNTLSQRVTALENSGTGGGSGGTTSVVSYNPSVLSGKLLGTLTINGVDNKIYAPAIPTKLSAFTNDEGYVTEDWVNEQGFLTEEQDISHLLSKTEAANTYQPKGNYVTENALNGKGYLTQSDAEDTYQPKGDYAELDDLNSYLLISAAKNTYATKTALNNAIQAHDELREEFDTLNGLLTDDTSGYIDTWNEVKNFLDGYSESPDLASILSGMNEDIANRATIDALNGATTRISTLEATLVTEQGYIDTLQGYFTSGKAKKAIADGNGNNIVDTYATKVALNITNTSLDTLSKEFNEFKELINSLWYLDPDHANTVRTKLNVVVEQAISFGGYGESSGTGGGITQVTKQMVLDALEYTPYDAANPKGYVTSTTFNALAERVAKLENTNKPCSLEDVIGIDENGDVYIKKNGSIARNFYTYGAISFGGNGEGSTGGSEGGLTAFNVVVNGVTYSSSGDTVTVTEKLATQSALTALSTKINGYDSRLTALENLWHWSNEHNAVETNHDVVVKKAISFGGYGESSGSGAGLTQVTVKLGDTSYISDGGVVSLPAYPTVPKVLSAFTNDVGYITSSALSNYLTTNTPQTVLASGAKIFKGTCGENIYIGGTKSGISIDINVANGGFARAISFINSADSFSDYVQFGIYGNSGIGIQNAFISVGEQDYNNAILNIYTDRIAVAGAASFSGLTTHSAGLKIGTTNVTEKSQNNTKYVEIDGNLVVTGAISFGGFGEGGSTGGGITSVTKDMVIDALGYTPYNAANPNGYITASSIPTSLKNPYGLTINNSAGTAQVSYDGSATKSLTLTKSIVGLSNVDNTADASKYVKGVIDYGTPTSNILIGYGGAGLTSTDATHLAAYSTTSAGARVIKDISKAETRTWLGLGSLAYKSSLAFNELTGKPTTLSGYGITNAYTKSEADSLFFGLDVVGIDASGVTNLNKVGYGYATGGWYGSGPALAFGSTNGYTALIQQGSNSYTLRVSYKSNGGDIQEWRTLAFTDSNVLSAQNLKHSNGTLGATVSSAGNVGIGTTNPSSKLHIAGDVTLSDTTGSASKSYKLKFLRRTGTDDYWDYGIYAQTTKGLTFYQSTEGINTDIAYLTGEGNFVVNGSITFGSASDRRLKDNIKSMTDEQAVAVLSALNPVTFNWNSTAYELGKLSGVSDGFIADEYEELIPNSGRDIWANYRAINYERATGYLVKGWQNHETRLEKAERRIKELENELKQYRRA